MSHYNTISEYKTKLQELHDLIKENPFRRGYEENMKYGTGYFKLVYQFAETFYHLIKDIRDNQLPDIGGLDRNLAKVDCLDFIHDFYAACGVSGASVSNYDFAPEKSMELIHRQEELLELDISCIHTYLETGRFDKYPSRFRKAIIWSEWDDTSQSYVYGPQSTISNNVLTK